MSAPAAIACGAVALSLGLAVIAAAGQLESRHRAGAAADAAALAAADAASGRLAGEPCAWAERVARTFGSELEACEVDPGSAEARVTVQIRVPVGWVRERARAGPPESAS